MPAYESAPLNLGPKRRPAGGARRGDYRVSVTTSSLSLTTHQEVEIFDGEEWVDRFELLDARRRLDRIRRSAGVLAADLTDALR